MVIKHVFSSPIADGTNTQLVRPSDWNQTHAFTLPQAIIISGNTSGILATISSGSLLLGGGNNITLSQSQNSITISAASQSVQTQNMVTLNNSTGAILISGGNNITVGNNASTITISAFNQSEQTQNIIKGAVIAGNTSGATASITSGTMLLAGGNNVTLSQDSNSVTISAGAGGIGGISAGTQEATSGTVQFVDSHGISFGLSDQTITASHNALTSQSVQTQNMVSINNSIGAILISGGDNITVGNNASTITISGYPAQTEQTQNRFNLTLSSNTSGTLALVSSGVLTLAGGNNITLSQAGNAITISGGVAGEADGVNIIAAGTQTANTTGTVVFSNSNSITFGMSNSSIVTASFSQSVQTQNMVSVNNSVGAISISGGNNITVGNNASTITISGPNTHAQQTGLSAVYPVGNTTGTTGSITSGTFALAGGDNITLSQSSGANSTVISIIGGAGAAGDGVNILAAGTQTANTTGTVVFSNSNSFTFGMSNSSVITASFSQSTHAHSAISGIAAGTQTATSGTIVWSNSNNVSFGMSNSSIITATASFAQSTQPAVGSLNGSSGTLTISAGNLMSISNNASTINVINILSSSAIAQPVSSVSSAGSLASRFALADHAHQGVGGVIGAGANGTATFYGSMTLAAGNNITLSTGANVLSIHGGAGAGGLGALANSNTTYTSGTVRLSEQANITIQSSVDGVSQYFRFSCPTPGGGPTLSDYRPLENEFTSVGTIPQGSLSIRPVFIPFNVTATEMRFAESLNVATQSNNSSAGQNVSINVAVYTLNVSSISRASSGSTYQYASYSSNATGSVTGMKQLTVPIGLNMTPGAYWIGVAISTATSGQTSLAQTRSLYGNNKIPTAAQAINIGIVGSGTATIRHAYPFLGIYTAATSACPVSISSGQMNVTSASNPVRARFWFEMRGDGVFW